MRRTALQSAGLAFLLAAAILASSCDSRTPLGPDPQATPDRAAATVAGSILTTDPDRRTPELGDCGALQVTDGRLAYRTHARGVQIYHWNGTGWTFSGPSATLYADDQGRGVVGTHYAGPTWESLSGSKVVGTVVERCTPDPDAIAWLLLAATSSQGPGIFRGVTFIQRINPVGGIAPSQPGSFVGEEARVPYTTDYLFYRAR